MPTDLASASPPRRRSVVSFVRRGTRLTASEQRAWDAHSAQYVVEVPRGASFTSIDPSWRLEPIGVFGREAPLVLEIGSGAGETLSANAAALPGVDFLGCEVYLPGIARTMGALAAAGATNVRLIQADAIALLTTAIAPGSLAEVWLFFPDPWPKARHHKRRIVTEQFCALVARALAPGGVWRCATDWPDYAEAIDAVVAASGVFVPAAAEPSDVFIGRPATKFGQRARREGRDVAERAFTVHPDFTMSTSVLPKETATP